MSAAFHPILLATGDLSLVSTVLRALTKAGVRNIVDVMDNERSAWKYLLGVRDEGQDTTPPPTALALLDGRWREFPLRVRGEAPLEHVPLLVLTADEERERSYSSLRTSACLSPPISPDRLLARLGTLEATRLVLD